MDITQYDQGDLDDDLKLTREIAREILEGTEKDPVTSRVTIGNPDGSEYIVMVIRRSRA